MARSKVLICGDIVWAHEETRALLGDLADVVIMDSPSRDDFFARLASDYAGTVAIYRHNSSADRIGIFDEELVKRLPDSTKWIGHNGAGYDQIDVAACKARGITVSHTPGAVDDATATTAFYLLISVVRQFSIAERNLRAGNWKSGLKPAHDPSQKTLAILGMGGIGLRLAELAHAFPMRVVYHNRKPRQDVPEWAEYFSAERLGEMLAQADVLSVHAPLRAETVGLVGEKQIRALKNGAYIVNTARGKVIDEEALIAALNDGHLAGAGLDVYPDEPHVNPAFLTIPTVTLLPHMGTETQESQRKMEVRALENIRDYFTKGSGKDIVPEMRPMARI